MGSNLADVHNMKSSRERTQQREKIPHVEIFNFEIAHEGHPDERQKNQHPETTAVSFSRKQHRDQGNEKRI